jgi:hypothetical protein
MSAITVVTLAVTLAVSGGAVGLSALAASLLDRARGGPSRRARSTMVRADTPFVEADALRAALADLGIEREDILDRAGSGGRDGITLRRTAIPWSEKDVRFEREVNGKFKVIAEGCPPVAVEQWLKEVVPRYAYHVTLAKLGDQGFELVAEETQQSGQIHLKLRRIA